jgi:hypothetical protein
MGYTQMAYGQNTRAAGTRNSSICYELLRATRSSCSRRKTRLAVICNVL